MSRLIPYLKIVFLLVFVSIEIKINRSCNRAGADSKLEMGTTNSRKGSARGCSVGTWIDRLLGASKIPYGTLLMTPGSPHYDFKSVKHAART